MRRILITGGGSGIGRAIAQHYADRGDDVTIAGRRMDALEETNGGRGMTCKHLDVTEEASVKALFDAPYDVVIANAGSGKAMRVADMPLEVWQGTLSVNLTGVFLTFREALKGMTAGGRLIAIASTASLKGGANIAAYSAAKHGVLGLVRSLAVELAREGITCNAVCPGFVDTDMGQAAVTGVMERMNIPREKAEKMVVGGNPMRRMIRTDEVVAAVQFLASPEASMVNGHALSVSGGGNMTAAKDRVRLWLRLLKVVRGIEHQLRDNLRRDYNTTLPRFDVMSALSRHPEGLKMSQLSGVLRVSNGNVTGIADRLSDEGFVERIAVPGDRRATRLRLTRAGEAEFARQALSHEKWVDLMLADVTPEDARAMAARLQAFADAADQADMEMNKKEPENAQ